MFHLMDTNQLLRLARDAKLGDYERACVERLDDVDRKLQELAEVLDNFYLHSDPSLLTYELEKMQDEIRDLKQENAELRAEIDSLCGK
jgi:predicted nuclease with TOPRIM domain